METGLECTWRRLNARRAVERYQGKENGHLDGRDIYVDTTRLPGVGFLGTAVVLIIEKLTSGFWKMRLGWSLDDVRL